MQWINQLLGDIPGWVVPLTTSVLTGCGTVLVAVFNYRNQRQKILNELEGTKKDLRQLDINEFREISEGNKALRDALLERVSSGERDLIAMKKAHQDCERRLIQAELKLERLGVRIDSLEVSRDEETVRYNR